MLLCGFTEKKKKLWFDDKVDKSYVGDLQLWLALPADVNDTVSSPKQHKPHKALQWNLA